MQIRTGRTITATMKTMMKMAITNTEASVILEAARPYKCVL